MVATPEQARDTIKQLVDLATITHFPDTHNETGKYRIEIGHHTIWIGEDGKIK
jgi:lysylphosphatidylglycerol synthetase-like protein (DUF2156 family)